MLSVVLLLPFALYLWGARATSVIRELQAAGLAADCCTPVSPSGDRDALAETGSDGAVDPRLNRRATFTLDYERSR